MTFYQKFEILERQNLDVISLVSPNGKTFSYRDFIHMMDNVFGSRWRNKKCDEWEFITEREARYV